jgi:hypothetical protein
MVTVEETSWKIKQRWESNFKLTLTEICFEDVEWIHLA